VDSEAYNEMIRRVNEAREQYKHLPPNELHQKLCDTRDAFVGEIRRQYGLAESWNQS
jgi:hypothetical protein